jgi:NAD(P)-dependent dehydrogenase (short-subunit alcohol dehydrogenase family)
VEISGKRAVVVGRSNIVGTPVAMLLTNRDATVTVLHSRSQDAQQICATADIVIAAVGKPEVVKADWIKPGAAVIDVGTNAVDVNPHPPFPVPSPLFHELNSFETSLLFKIDIPMVNNGLCNPPLRTTSTPSDLLLSLAVTLNSCDFIAHFTFPLPFISIVAK